MCLSSLEPTDLNNAAVFTDSNMNPSEWTHLQKQRRRRQINFNDEFRQRRKRALASYDFYNRDPVRTAAGQLTSAENRLCQEIDVFSSCTNHGLSPNHCLVLLVMSSK